VSDLSNIASLSLEILDAETRGTLLLSKTLTGAELDTSLTTETNWTDGTKQHALITVTGAETNIDISSGLTRNCWLVVSVVTNNSPGRNVTIQASTIMIVEDGTGTSAEPPDLTDNYYPTDVSDARYQQRHADGASIQFKDGKDPYIYCVDSDLWYPLVVRLVDGVAVLGLGAGESL